MKASLKSLLAEIASATPAMPEAVPTEVHTEPTHRTAQTRASMRQIAGHFHPDVAQALRVLAAEQDNDHQELLAEALAMLFKRYGKPVAIEIDRGRRKKG